MKPTDSGEWAHVVCALWIPGAQVGGGLISIVGKISEFSDKMEPIIGINQVRENSERMNMVKFSHMLSELLDLLLM